MSIMLRGILLILVLLGVATTGLSQVSSEGASVTLNARVEESVTVRAFPVSTGEASLHTAQPNPTALHVLLDWRLQGGRTYRVGYGLEGNDKPSAVVTLPEFLSLRQLQAQAAAFSFLPARRDQPVVLGVWGDTNREPTGAASFLLAVPSADETQSDTLRISVAVF